MEKSKPDSHPIAAAVGKALGTIAAKTGLAHAEKPKPSAKKRQPRKVKKEMKKAAAKSSR
ncbi:MAG: hypothetical protein ABI972_08580 [Acidobacteriota bacterium]